MRRDTCDVLIVGAGPVGLLLALMLHQRGVDVKIVERQKSLYPLPRAVMMDHESRRLFGSAGLSEQIDAIVQDIIGKGGEDGSNFVWRDKDLKLIVDLYFEAPTRSGYPFAYVFAQPEAERMLEKEVRERGIPLVRGYALRHLEQYADRVEAELSPSSPKEKKCVENGIDPDDKRANGTTSNGDGNGHHSNGHSEEELHVRASYLVGCDGANSTVRRLQDFTVTDLSFENDWLIVDMLLRDDYVPSLVRRIGSAQICDPARPTTCVASGSGRKRFEFMRLPGESKESLTEDDKLWELMAPWGFTKDNCELERKAIYTFKARWANEFFRGRVALAGDALHLMPPFIGQGLNSGFRDAGALAWRLPLILKGIANPEGLLQSYQNERLAHIKTLTEQCILLGGVICETDPVKSKEIHTTLRQNPPAKVYDPPLGQPGILTTQPEAGRLSLQRRVRVKKRGDPALFDDAHGYGWRLITYGQEGIGTELSSDSRRFFLDSLGGRCVNIAAHEDETGEYREWFKEEMALDHAVLIRPDFYVFGHAPVTAVDELIGDLRSKLGAA